MNSLQNLEKYHSKDLISPIKPKQDKPHRIYGIYNTIDKRKIKEYLEIFKEAKIKSNFVIKKNELVNFLTHKRGKEKEKNH